MDNELNVRGIVRPEVSVRGSVTPEVSLRGSVQKGIGTFGIIMKTKAEWAMFPHLMSVRGYFYVYTDYRQEEDPETHEITNIPRMKIGDGSTYVVDLPFTTSSITDEDIARWDNKSNLQIIVDDAEHNVIFYNNE